MLRVYDGAGRLIVEVEGPWLHPVVWLFSQEADSVREVLSGDPDARVFDSVVGTAALGCYRLLGVTRVDAQLSDSSTVDLARAWNIALSAERTVPAIQCNAEADVAALAEQNGGLPDPPAVLAMLRRRARARPVTVSVRFPKPAGADENSGAAQG
ncbi:MAG: hypothetical protein ACOCRN_03665 [Spirochaetia bacterium]